MMFIKTLQKMLKQVLHTSNYELNRPYKKERTRKLLMKIMKEFIGLKTKTFKNSYSTDNNDEDKKN